MNVNAISFCLSLALTIKMYCSTFCYVCIVEMNNSDIDSEHNNNNIH